ncbi:MAG: hypothetical protein JNK14_05710 [Chitinophagaceae bacterium]|nr:hypothetical protein [Chitinophagaceae bacterium]
MADIKLSDSEFLAILRENSGLFANTARAIEEKYGFPYSRQAVRQRALDHKEELEDIEESGLDVAESGMLTMAKSADEDIKFKACQFILKTKGKKRGYIERTELTGADGGPINVQTIRFE